MSKVVPSLRSYDIVVLRDIIDEVRNKKNLLIVSPPILVVYVVSTCQKKTISQQKTCSIVDDFQRFAIIKPIRTQQSDAGVKF